MFVCVFHDFAHSTDMESIEFFGMGETPQIAFEDMLTRNGMVEDEINVDDTEFYTWVAVTRETRTVWELADTEFMD